MSNDRRTARTMDRRSFMKASALFGAASISAGWTGRPARGKAAESEPAAPGPEIIDTNVHLLSWPFRKLKYARSGSLVEKLRQHRITQAWAGSFEALLHKQLDEANRRLTEECRNAGGGMLVPLGSVNPVWPDWDEDLRRCHEQYGMRGVRLYPGYHGYTLDHPEFARLLDAAARRQMLVQIALSLEDERVHHPATDVPVVDVAPLPDVLKKVPSVRLQLINSASALRGGYVADLVQSPPVTFDISEIEGNGGVGRLIDGTHPNYRGPVPVEKLLFGSHAPFYPCESALLKLFESPLSLAQLEKLMRANARTLLAA